MSMLFEIDRVTKTYARDGNRVEALKAVSFAVHAGEALAIMGPSGSGKSTLLHLLGGLDLPSSGHVRFKGEDLFRYTADERAAWRNRHVGFVFQFHHLLGEFSALENTAMPLLIGGMNQSEAFDRARTLLSDLELSERVDHLPSALSGGERERVAIARALVQDPEVILADEPTGSLDQKQGERVLEYLLNSERAKKAALVMVTHNAEMASRLDRTLTLRDGALV